MYDHSVAGELGSLTAPPYDVISESERQGYFAANPYNTIRLELPELPYDEVAGLIATWVKAGALRQPDEPVLIGWTQTFTLPDGTHHERKTILGVVGVEPYSARVVRPHERTHAGPKEDRLRLIRATQVNISPVYGLYPDPEGAVWAAAGVTGEPQSLVVDPDGTEHRIWILSDPDALAEVEREMADRWILIADGHHRYETAAAYRDERGPGTPADFVMMGLTALDDPGLVVLPTHRVLTEWPDGAASRLTAMPVADLAAMEAALAAADPASPAFGLVRPDGFSLLTMAADPSATAGGRLDTAVLEREILVPAFEMDQAKLAHDALLTYVKEATDAAALVASGKAAAALIMRPTSKLQVADVAEAGETMPQKSTYFFPKLLTGIAFNPLG